jgi:hypothetical protein
MERIGMSTSMNRCRLFAAVLAVVVARGTWVRHRAPKIGQSTRLSEP